MEVVARVERHQVAAAEPLEESCREVKVVCTCLALLRVCLTRRFDAQISVQIHSVMSSCFGGGHCCAIVSAEALQSRSQ